MVSGVPTGISFASFRMSALLQAHAAVRDPPGDQPGLRGAVDAHDAAAGPVGQRGPRSRW